MSMSIEIEFNEAIIAQLQKLPLLMRLGPAERVLKAMAKPIVAKGKAIAPSSRESGTRNKWGKKYKNNPAYQNDSGKALGTKYIKTERGGVLIVGGKHPEANKQNYEAGTKRKVFYWGRDSGKVKRIDPKQRFMQRAYDETIAEQLTAGEAQLRKEIEGLKIG